MRFFLGPPCAGKGTVARKINIPFLSAGELLREKAKTNPEIKSVLDRGELVLLETTANILMDKAKEYNYNVFLDGFPRTSEQAQFVVNFMQQNNIKNEGIFILNTDKETLKQRTLSRFYCYQCHNTYNQNHNCCNKFTERRSDDNLEVFEKRYNNFFDSIFDVLTILEGPVFFIPNHQNKIEKTIKHIEKFLNY